MNGLSHQRAKEQAALAAAEVRAQTGSLAERQAALKRTLAIREDLISQTQQIQEEYEREKRRKDEMVLERIDLELELESETRSWERNMLDRKRMEQPVVTQLMPGVVSSVDLICLRSELTVQKELTEQEVAQSSLANGRIFFPHAHTFLIFLGRSANSSIRHRAMKQSEVGKRLPKQRPFWLQ